MTTKMMRDELDCIFDQEGARDPLRSVTPNPPMSARSGLPHQYINAPKVWTDWATPLTSIAEVF